MKAIPHLVGNPLPEVTAKQLNENEIYVLGVKDPHNPNNSLYCINKENLFARAFQDKDIDEGIFNNPTFETSYQDVLPNNFTGLPDLARIGIDNYTLPWTVEFRRNPVFSETINGVQFVTTLSGLRFMRYGVSGVFAPWQLVSDNIFGALQHMMIDKTNYMGWLSFGSTYTRKEYPDLYDLLKNKVTSTADTFTLPNARGHYIASGDAGKTKAWAMPDLTDDVGFVKGLSKSLIRNKIEVNSLFKIKNKDNSDTANTYLDDAIFKEVKDGNPTVSDDGGLTSELKLDLAGKIGAEHIGDKIMPDTIFSSGLYIYAGYPQI